MARDTKTKLKTFMMGFQIGVHSGLDEVLTREGTCGDAPITLQSFGVRFPRMRRLLMRRQKGVSLLVGYLWIPCAGVELCLKLIRNNRRSTAGYGGGVVPVLWMGIVIETNPLCILGVVLDRRSLKRMLVQSPNLGEF